MKIKNQIPLFFRIINKFSEASGYISAFSILLSSVIIFLQVILRYFFGYTTVWQMELTIYLLMFTSFVGAAYGLKHDSHVGVDVIVERLPHKAKCIVRIITSILGLAVTIIVAWKAWEMWHEATVDGWKSDSAWGPPLTIPYFILPFGMSLVSLQFLVIIYEEVFKLKKAVENTENSTVKSHDQTQ
jgi:TRAP-type C4-dicarboxylate transport system permease small subunit